MFLPTTRTELSKLGWNKLDIILVSGDSYIDSPFIGTSVIGKVLTNAGYRVGIIAQPALYSQQDIIRLGEPKLFWGVTSGSVDSMIANYTSLLKKRRSDDYTPGGINNRRPDRATIIYTNLIKQYFKNTVPIVLGGIETSLRRIAHYDYWSDKIRGAILFDAKADYLLYGMAERSVLEVAEKIKNKVSLHNIKGLCYIANESEIANKRGEYIELPSFEEVAVDKQAFMKMFQTFYRNNGALTATGMYQQHGKRYLVHNPSALPLTQRELDAVYALDFERAQHPYYERQGKVKALETIKFSLSTHRGCYGECNFCAITVHEGRTVQWRSIASILSEATKLTLYPDFKGYIMDIGGPTVNMYGFECDKKLKRGACDHKRCLYPEVCPSLKADHRHQLELLGKIRKIPGVKKAFVASGLRYDLLLSDKKYSASYLEEIVIHHVSGQMKIAPEHTDDYLLRLMGKPSTKSLIQFKDLFDRANLKAGKKQFLTYYLIAAHPGCTEADMLKLKQFASNKLHINPEQVQIYLPAPSTYSALMYYTGIDPFTHKPIFVEKNLKKKEIQKEIVVGK